MLLQYTKIGRGPRQDWFSVGDLSKLDLWVRTLHGTAMPVGLYIPFATAWLAVNEFMETEGQLPASIDWISSDDVPDGRFPDPMDVDETRVLPDPSDAAQASRVRGWGHAQKGLARASSRT